MLWACIFIYEEALARIDASVEGCRRMGRPKVTWMEVVSNDMEKIEIISTVVLVGMLGK